MDQFDAMIQPQSSDLVLDVGGYPRTWTTGPQVPERIDCMSIHPIEWDTEAFPDHRIITTVGDGCALKEPDGSYDTLFSNSVIEHVGDWQNQVRLASEVRRVGKKLWIQTPAVAGPIEPHYPAPFVHWLPVSVRRKMLRWFTPWGWIQKPSQEKVDKTIRFTRLLSKKQMTELFPDCEIITERLLWIFPKSYVAWRLEPSETD